MAAPLLGLLAASSAWMRAAPTARAPLRGIGRRLQHAPVASLSARHPPTAAQPTLDVLAWLDARVKEALVECYGPELRDAPSLVTPATKPDFGDYQCNVAMPLAKQLRSAPRAIAAELSAALRLDGVCEPPEVAGPGFLNLRLTRAFLTSELGKMLADDERCGVAAAAPAQRVVVDYSSPNIAKEMHVGHLRSTILGDTLAKLLEFLGHDVLRLNHVGDWGTQFGMLILHLRDEAPAVLAGEAQLDLSDLVQLYKQSKARFDADEAFQRDARAEVVRLQAGDERSLSAWKALVEQSEAAFRQVYVTLGVDPRLQTRGESFYNPMLPEVLATLRDASLLQAEAEAHEESDGAQCVFLDGYKNREGAPQPMIVQKSDGGFMYSTTDLAAVAHRVKVERAQRVLYVTDAGQAQHFQQVFEISRLAGMVPEGVSLEHVPFGLVLSEDGKKFKTRSGETVKLTALLDEALARARADVTARLQAEGREESEEFIAKVSRAVGIGAVKYADLAMNRNSNYKFSFDKMLSLSGNTAPYMLYAYARIRGIERRVAQELGGEGGVQSEAGPVKLLLLEDAELNLARHLLRVGEVVREVERDLLPSKLCEYIFELSSKFNQFYESCPVLQAESAEVQRSRLALCQVTASVLRLNLGLLGMEALEAI